MLLSIQAAASCCGPPLIPNEVRDGVIGYERDTAHLAALSNPNESPVSLLFAFVVVTAAKPKVRIAARLREAKEFRAGLRRSRRAFASWSS